MIEYHQGYTAIKRHGRNSFKPVGKHPFRIIRNACTIKDNLIQQFESETGIILPSEAKSALRTQPVPFLGKELAVIKLHIKENKK